MVIMPKILNIIVKSLVSLSSVHSVSSELPKEVQIGQLQPLRIVCMLA